MLQHIVLFRCSVQSPDVSYVVLPTYPCLTGLYLRNDRELSSVIISVMSVVYEDYENIKSLFDNGALVVDTRDPAEIEQHGDAIEGVIFCI